MDKFENIKDMVLYVVARIRNLSTIDEIHKEIQDKEKQKIYVSLRKLEEEKLVKKYNRLKGNEAIYGLNLRSINKIKKILGEHWENNWEAEWNVVAEK